MQVKGNVLALLHGIVLSTEMCQSEEGKAVASPHEPNTNFGEFDSYRKATWVQQHPFFRLSYFCSQHNDRVGLACYPSVLLLELFTQNLVGIILSERNTIASILLNGRGAHKQTQKCHSL